MWEALKISKKIRFLIKFLVEPLILIYKVYDMFSFFFEIKARIKALEEDVKTLFSHVTKDVHTVPAEVAKVEEEVKKDAA